MRPIIIGLVSKSVALHRHSDTSSLGEEGNRGLREDVVVLKSRAGSGNTAGNGVAVGTPMPTNGALM